MAKTLRYLGWILMSTTLMVCQFVEVELSIINDEVVEDRTCQGDLWQQQASQWIQIAASEMEVATNFDRCDELLDQAIAESSLIHQQSNEQLAVLIGQQYRF
jgi:hypothetical protein